MKINKPEPKLRRSNKIRSIQSSLAIEGNTLSIDQVTAVLDGKKVLGSKKEILEIQNAIKAYDQISDFKPFSPQSLREAHRILMEGLIADAGKWRNSNVGIFHGDKIAHAAPQAKRVPELMESLFSFIKKEKDTHALIVSSIFHYELEFIHPFSDGNGRIGRLWQTVLLRRFHPIFEFTPVESVIRKQQSAYYEALGSSDKTGQANPFIEFSLSTIHQALNELFQDIKPTPLTSEDRLHFAMEAFSQKKFSRKDYLQVFKTISTATASRDLSVGVKQGQLIKSGDKRMSLYRFKK